MDAGRKNFLASLLAVLLMSFVGVVYGQEYLALSIDCGSEVNYTDAKGIHWVTDAGYISTGTNVGNISVRRNLSNADNQDRPLINAKQGETLRYFDGTRSRYCYVLPTKPRSTYLVRPTFYLGDWRSPPDMNFQVYINATKWLDFNFASSNLDPYVTYVPEGIFYSPGREFYMCLVTGQGTPFISAMEMRELAPGMYSNVVGSFQFINNLGRSNYGAVPATNSSPSSILRYPDDPFDRAWPSPDRRFTNTRISKNLSSTSIITQEKPPLKVMEDAAIAFPSGYISYYYEQDKPVGAITTYGYFQELDESASDTNVRGLELYVNDVFVRSFNTSTTALEISTAVLQVPEDYFNLTFRRAPWSQLPPLINAFEIYASNPVVIAPTDTRDFKEVAFKEVEVEEVEVRSGATTGYLGLRTLGMVLLSVNVLAGIQTTFNLTDGTGDPCTPVSFNWLGCAAEVTFGSSQYQILTNRITTLTLAGKGKSPTLPQEITELTKLSTLNVSNTGLTELSRVNNLTVLDVSNNFLGGNVGKFVKAIDLRNMEKIFAANNSLEGEFPSELLDKQLENLEIVNFDGNPSISGTLNLTSWYEYLQSASRSPMAKSRVTSLINNGVDDIFPSEDKLTRAMEGIIDSLNTTSLDNAILLGGNPWCNGKNSTHQSLATRFLCRFNVDEPYKRTVEPSSNRNTAIIVGLTTSSCALAVCLISLAFFWKLKRKSAALWAIQEALSQQKVQPPFYSYSELRAATRNFASENHLGQGGYGTVSKGKLADGTLVAVKRLHTTSAKKALSEFLNEVVLITGIKHRNLVQLKGCCIKDHQRLLVYEYVENGNLAEALWGSEKNELKLNWQQRLKVCVGIARGLSYLHEELQPRIIHRDIKPANVLIDSALNAKIADFGLARSLLENESHAEYTNVVGTLGYFAPEYFIQGHLTEKADVFSFGVVMLEIFSGRKCIDRRLPAERVSLMKWVGLLYQEGRTLDLLDSSIQSTPDEDEAKRVIDVACSCLSTNPAERPTMSHVAILLQGCGDILSLGRDFSSPVFQGDLINQGFSRSPYRTDPSGSSSLGTLQEELCLLGARRSTTDSASGVSTSSDQATLEMSVQQGR